MSEFDKETSKKSKNLGKDEEEREVGGGKSVRKRKLPSWRRENADDCEEEEENEQIVGKRKLYSQRKNTFSRKEKGVRMLQTPVSESNRIW